MSVALAAEADAARAPDPKNALLRVTDVSKRFGGLLAVDACHFDIREGSITGLIGPNGAGKTTLFNIIAGVFPPSGGRITFAGEDVTGLASHALFHKGLVRTFQIPHEFHRMTVLENLLLVPPGQTGERVWNGWLRWGAVRRQEAALQRRALDVLDFLGMSHVKDSLAGHLSGGQKKLLELGRTMMTDARLVLLDEPGAGVNKTLLIEIAEFIRRLNRERGYTICIIEHDMDLIAALCDPVIVMAEGRVLMEGSMAEVRAHPEVLEAYLGQPTGAAA
ncbi:MAG: ABC transporter ATP-binding protein [Geminicoccaceae bacterium]|nr:MAG: ABC transporter ATP-binding protein [Geminicoccaceae bacterium]